ncbi:protein FAR-RED IMPAIRED RESPONSE 1-like [Hevea brasiliensis]|uniref:protein FAR-RED IMPAIRED RESPONSE 1-like n=1 Tax=Hevea brasiliensis TaxID=3981 RepID=UPI0025D7C491|nr:protein FAR-RED IMPAIRED RESPONSE 1-like [Hevea brasiliensis]
MVAHKSLNMDMKRRLEANNITGIRATKSIRLLEVQAGGLENDVVSFDNTYLVNRYKLPFATIIGVNHHRQSILLGCALISHEDVNTFKWLFITWLEGMGDFHPNSIITDQCESMRKAIREVMPNTRHRFCLWHILCKVPEKFRGVIDYDSACLEFKALIYDSLTIEMFERNWNEFVVKHRLERNEWLSKLYVDR